MSGSAQVDILGPREPENALQQRISRSDEIAHWGGLAVIAGLMLDIIIVCLEPWPFYRRALQIVADALIALGVFAELHYGRIASDARDTLRSDAKERAANANRLAEEARERAALIEKTYAWRRVSRELRERLVTAIGQASSPLIVRIEYQSGDPEAHRLANEIGHTFSQAAVRNFTLVPNSYPLQSMYGLFAAHSPTLDIGGLIATFADAGMPITLRAKDLAQPHVSVNALPPNLYLFVGMKPWLSSLENEAPAGDPQSPAY